MKVCLATVHANAWFTPLALLYLKAWLVEREGLPRDAVAILEFTKESSQEDIVASLLAAEPDIVGLSCYVWNVKTLMAVAATIKARRPDVDRARRAGGRTDAVGAGRPSRGGRDRPQRRRGPVRRDRRRLERRTAPRRAGHRAADRRAAVAGDIVESETLRSCAT